MNLMDDFVHQVLSFTSMTVTKKGRTTISFDLTPSEAQYQHKASNAAGAAGRRPTVDISDVLPPTQSNMRNLANHPSISDDQAAAENGEVAAEGLHLYFMLNKWSAAYGQLEGEIYVRI